MSHDTRRLVPILLAAAAALAPVYASAADRAPDAIRLAQATPEEDKKSKKGGDKEERREKKNERKEERRDERAVRKNERLEDKKERVDDRKERFDAKKDDARRNTEELKRRQDAEKAAKEELRRNKETERLRKQAEDDKRRKVRERADEPRRSDPVRDPKRDEGRDGKRDIPADAKRDERRRGVNPPEVRAAKPEFRATRPDEIRESYRRAPKKDRSFDDLKRNRRERTIADGKLRVIEEPDRRVIVKQNNRSFIRHDESERFRRISKDARTIRGANGTSTTFMTRKGGIRIYDVSDRHGRMLYRYRRYPGGRQVILIDNRRYYRRDNRSRDVLIGAGIGLLLGSAIALSAPDVRIPRDRYIVDYGRASEDDLYEALSAPPVERLERGYSLEEIRYSRYLRDRMRRIDLDTVTFDFGSWEVGPDQARALDRLAEGINRLLERNPDEIVMIEGHTDAVGDEEDNLTLSDRRAQAVAEILTTEYGVPPENLVTQGYGEEQLKIPTDGPERLNRRITVRRIGPLLSGRFDESAGGPPADRDDDRDDGRYDDAPPPDGRDDGPYDDRR